MARPRMPDAIKKIQGTFQPSRSMPAAPPLTKELSKEIPRWLYDDGDDAVEIYSQLIVALDGMKVLAAEDDHCVALAASALAEVRSCSRMIYEEGRVYETKNVQGEYMKRSHPAVAQKADAMRRAQSLLMQMGLTPATRAQVSRRMEGENNPFAEIDG